MQRPSGRRRRSDRSSDPQAGEEQVETDGAKQGEAKQPGRRLQGKLSADGMSKVDGLLQQIHSGFRRQFEQTESVRRQLHSILVTEPFDADAFSRTLEALNANRTRFDSDMSQDIVAAVRALSPDDRRILADAVLSLPPGPLG